MKTEFCHIRWRCLSGNHSIPLGRVLQLYLCTYQLKVTFLAVHFFLNSLFTATLIYCLNITSDVSSFESSALGRTIFYHSSARSYTKVLNHFDFSPAMFL